MPRRPRIHLGTVPLHIMQRGHNREPCFFAEEDYLPQFFVHSVLLHPGVDLNVWSQAGHDLFQR